MKSTGKNRQTSFRLSFAYTTLYPAPPSITDECAMKWIAFDTHVYTVDESFCNLSGYQMFAFLFDISRSSGNRSSNNNNKRTSVPLEREREGLCLAGCVFKSTVRLKDANTKFEFYGLYVRFYW